ncbi:MAG: DNA repair protein RadC [Bacillota bacterium]|nr:DNA repair protein RadC [Bacillota bacterium]
MNRLMKIIDLPESERPRERLLRYGAEGISNSELLAIVLRTGSKNEDIISLANRLITLNKGLNGLLTASISELLNIDGIGPTKAAQIIAIGELSKRFRTFRSGDEYKISRPKDAADLLMEEMRTLSKEHLKVMLLNTKNNVIKVCDVSMGSLNSSIVHPREVFYEAISNHSASIVVCHNHPSGDPSPSSEDINVTIRLKECGRLLGIELLDHIIIGNGTYISLKEKGIL